MPKAKRVIVATLSGVLCGFICFALASGGPNELAKTDDPPSKIDTLIQEPAQAGDLPEAVVAWLERRNYLIPIYGGESGYEVQYGNTLIGSFMGENTKDCAVLTIPRGALEDSCSVWVFPSGDTLSPMLLGTYKTFNDGSQWQPSYQIKSQLEYAWCIRPFWADDVAADLKHLQQLHVDLKELPKITHQGIFILLAEKDPGPFYYYNGKEWLILPVGQ